MYKPWYKHRYESNLWTECQMKRDLIMPPPSRSSLTVFTALWAVQACGQTTAAIRGAITDEANGLR